MGLAGNGTICNLVATHFFQWQNAPAYFLAVDRALLSRAANGRDSASSFNPGSVMLSSSGLIS